MLPPSQQGLLVNIFAAEINKSILFDFGSTGTGKPGVFDLPRGSFP